MINTDYLFLVGDTKDHKSEARGLLLKIKSKLLPVVYKDMFIN